MNPTLIGRKYNKIADWWHHHHNRSAYGVAQFQKALAFVAMHGKVLDIGCGAGGRFIRILEQQRFAVTGVDVSEEMIRLARHNHSEHTFIHADICCWETTEHFDLIFAWDSLFHLPYGMHKPVLSKLCQWLNPGGVLLYTFGDAVGEHTDQWHEDTFYYSSIGINENLSLLMGQNLSIRHLELDQYPEQHAYVIAVKPA